MKYAIIVIAALFIIGCRKSNSVKVSTESKSPSIYATDQHPDPQITIKESYSIYAETIKLGSDNWDGNQWIDYKFECPSASLDRVLKFLYMKDGGKTPAIYGVDILPECQFMIDFGDRRWNSQEDARKDIQLAVENAFGIAIEYNESADSLTIIRRKIPNHGEAEQVDTSNGG